MKPNRENENELDLKWLLLMIEARERGFEPDEIREFLSRHKNQDQSNKNKKEP